METANEVEQIPLKMNSSPKYEEPEVPDKKKKTESFLQSLWKVVVHRIYILSWIRNYDRETAIADLIAGW